MDVTDEPTVRSEADVVQSSENNLVPNVLNPAATSGNIIATEDVNCLTEQAQNDSGEVADCVSSTTESARIALPSINHRSVVMPNMEPYLEEGSLDGTKAESQDPTSSNNDVEMKNEIDSSNCVIDSNNSTLPPTVSSVAEEEFAAELTPVESLQSNLIGNDQEGEEATAVNGDVSSGGELLVENNVDTVKVSQDSSENDEAETSNTEGTERVEDVAGSSSEVENGADPFAATAEVSTAGETVQVDDEVDQQGLVSSLTQEEPAQEPASSIAPDAIEEPVTEADCLEAVDEGQAVESAGLVDSSNYPVENDTLETDAAIVEADNIQPESACQEDAALLDGTQQCQTSDQVDEQAAEVNPIDSSSLLTTEPLPVINAEQQEAAQPEANDEVEEDNEPQQSVMTADEYDYTTTEPNEMAPLEPATVCEADSSATVLDDQQTYEAQEMDPQNVYVVDSGQLTLNSVPQSGSMTPYHNPENTMLVEMAPLPTDSSSFVNAQVQYASTGQEGMITDAQAAELLMRVSEQRPVGLQSIQQDAASSGQYVQVQLAQTVEGITHLVEVPVSALAGYCLPSTLVYSTPAGGSGGAEMATWVMEAPPSGDEQLQRTENKFSDIVSASIEAIGFPESVTPGANILSHAEQILIASEAQSSVTGSASSNFDFEDNPTSSLALMSDKTPSSYPRPKRESIESRIHRLLRGANAPVPDGNDETPASGGGKSGPKTVKVVSLQAQKPTQSASTVTVSLSKPIRPDNLNTRVVTIPTVFTATNQSKPNSLPPGCVEYIMPRGVNKRKAQGLKPPKVNPLNPNCIDAEPAPPEETQVKLLMTGDTLDDDDQLREDDEYNRAVLLQARQRKQSEQLSVQLNPDSLAKSCSGRSTSIHLSLTSDVNVNDCSPATDNSASPAKRVRLSFPPEKYANLEGLSTVNIADLQTPKLSYTVPRPRQTRSKLSKDPAGSIDNPVKSERDINVRLPWMDREDDDPKQVRVYPPRIIRQQAPAVQSLKVKTEEDEVDTDMEQDSGQVIVIGLDEAGKEPSEEQLTAIIQAAMAKQESPPVPERVIALTQPPKVYSSNSNSTKPVLSKRKTDEEKSVETEENGVRLKVIRTYDRSLGIVRRRPPRPKKLSPFIEIFEFDEEEDEEEDEEVDELEQFSKALADEENAIREKEKLLLHKNEAENQSSSRGRRGRGRGRARGGRLNSSGSSTVNSNSIEPALVVVKTKTRGRGGRGAKHRRRYGRVQSTVPEASEVPKDPLALDDDDDDDYKPFGGRGRRGGRSKRRGKRPGGRRGSSSREEAAVVEEDPLVEDEPVAEEENDNEEEEIDEERIPGMPSKSCPQCEERFTTRKGFLDHVLTHLSAKCPMGSCNWKNPSPKEKNRLKQHILNSHEESLPAASC